MFAVCPFCGQQGCPVGIASAGSVGAFFALCIQDWNILCRFLKQKLTNHGKESGPKGPGFNFVPPIGGTSACPLRGQAWLRRESPVRYPAGVVLSLVLAFLGTSSTCGSSRRPSLRCPHSTLLTKNDCPNRAFFANAGTA